jgi:hypothetical protein
VAATLTEARVSPEAGADEIRRYLVGGRDDRKGAVGERAWLLGDRMSAGVEPEGVAPPGRRFSR